MSDETFQKQYETGAYVADGKYYENLPDGKYTKIKSFGINNFNFPNVETDELIIFNTEIVNEVNFKKLLSLDTNELGKVNNFKLMHRDKKLVPISSKPSLSGKLISCKSEQLYMK